MFGGGDVLVSEKGIVMYGETQNLPHSFWLRYLAELNNCDYNEGDYNLLTNE